MRQGKFKKKLYIQPPHVCNKPSPPIQRHNHDNKSSGVYHTHQRSWELYKHCNRSWNGPFSSVQCVRENERQMLFPLLFLHPFLFPSPPCLLKHVVSCCASMWSDDQRQSGIVIVPRWSAARPGIRVPAGGGTAMRTAGEAGGTREALPGRNKDFLRVPLWQQSRLGRVKNEASTHLGGFFFWKGGKKGALMGGDGENECVRTRDYNIWRKGRLWLCDSWLSCWILSYPICIFWRKQSCHLVSVVPTMQNACAIVGNPAYGCVCTRRASKKERTTESAREWDKPWLSQCLPEDQRELWKLTSQPTSHICGSPQNTFHCCLSFWLPSMTPSTLRNPPPPSTSSSGQMAFFNSLCLAPPLSILGRSGRKGPAGDIGLCGQMVLR